MHSCEEGDIDEDIITLELSSTISAALKALTPSEQELINSIYFQNKRIVDLSLGVRRQYVALQRKRDKALSKLKQELENMGY